MFWGMALVSSIASAFWVNDYFDFDDDRANARKDLHPSKNRALIPGILAFLLSVVTGAWVSLPVLATVLLVAAASFLYSSPWTRFKSRLFVPFTIHFFMGVVFFQSAVSLGAFHWTRESFLMAFFWALVLGTGSLGNELVDQSVDEKAKIKTVANAYPQRIRALIFGIQTLALLVLMTNMVFLRLHVTLFLALATGLVYFLSYLKEGMNWSSAKFRRSYRILFVLIIVSFHAEKFFRS